jgi:hypothetical protein
MVNTVTLRQTAYAGMQRQEQRQARWGRVRQVCVLRQEGKSKLSGIVKQGGRQIQAIST